MVQLVEITGVLNEKGCIEIPIVLLAQTGTVTILVRPEQSKLLARLEAEGEIHLSLVFRGDADKASEFIKAQDQVLDEIKAAEEEALQEEGATEEDGQPVMNADSQETTEEEETTTDGEE